MAKKRQGLGLLTRMRAWVEKAFAEGTRLDEFDGGIIIIPPPGEVGEFPDRAPRKAWQAPCFFSCVPDAYEPVDVYCGKPITGGGGPTSPPTWIELCAFEVPRGHMFRWDKFGLGWPGPASGFLHFRLVLNDTVLGRSWGDFTHQAGALNVLDMFPLGVNVVGPQKVRILVYNTAVPSYDVYARIVGYLGARG